MPGLKVDGQNFRKKKYLVLLSQVQQKKNLIGSQETITFSCKLN